MKIKKILETLMRVLTIYKHKIVKNYNNKKNSEQENASKRMLNVAVAAKMAQVHGNKAVSEIATTSTGNNFISDKSPSATIKGVATSGPAIGASAPVIGAAPVGASDKKSTITTKLKNFRSGGSKGRGKNK